MMHLRLCSIAIYISSSPATRKSLELHNDSNCDKNNNIDLRFMIQSSTIQACVNHWYMATPTRARRAMGAPSLANAASSVG
ncbi:hypothetical protein K449DRAFT_164233 [Hypoxylon sp. EC38]|nr:hypothetical protein K449DRAFT_164233 [Hypoxylon sp. EC38]